MRLRGASSVKTISTRAGFVWKHFEMLPLDAHFALLAQIDPRKSALRHLSMANQLLLAWVLAPLRGAMIGLNAAIEDKTDHRKIPWPVKLKAALTRALCQPKLSFSPAPTPQVSLKNASGLLPSVPRLPSAKPTSHRFALS
jgi:hypothetical protein